MTELKGILTFVRKLLINLIVSLPFLGFGLYGFLINPEGVPVYASGICIGIGGFLLAVGFLLSFIASFPMPMLVEGEKELILRHPTMRPAYTRMLISVPFFGAAAYLALGTQSPYVYAFVVGLIGLWLFFKGATRYLRNLCITYLVTDRRIIHMYKFLWLYTNEIPVGRIISIQEARGLFEILTGRGSVVVSSGIGARMTIRMEEIDDPGPVANELRGLLPE